MCQNVCAFPLLGDLSVFLPACLYLRRLIDLSVGRSVNSSFARLLGWLVCLSAYLFVCLPVCLFVCLSVYLFFRLSVGRSVSGLVRWRFILWAFWGTCDFLFVCWRRRVLVHILFVSPAVHTIFVILDGTFFFSAVLLYESPRRKPG